MFLFSLFTQKPVLISNGFILSCLTCALCTGFSLARAIAVPSQPLREVLRPSVSTSRWVLLPDEGTEDFRLSLDARHVSLPSLTAIDSTLTARHATRADAIRVKEKSFPASAFGVFKEGESTFDADAIPHRFVDGWEPVVHNQYEKHAVPEDWFHESPSGCPDGIGPCFQTHYPAVSVGLAGHGPPLGEWTRGASGTWHQEYQHHIGTEDHDGTQTAGWFDSSVMQFDGFGRAKEPQLSSPARYTLWEERSVNTTLACATAGCSANVSLQAFNGNEERARFCKLSFYVHATDFDEQYSGEQVDWVTVNGAKVSVACRPHASGCNATAQRPMYPCVRDLVLDKLIGAGGALEIAAKINEKVDECPYKGNLLAAVPMVTCLVAPLPSGPLYAHNKGMGSLKEHGTDWSFIQVPLKCPQSGCTALVDIQMAPLGRKCFLTVRVNQTDFDGDQSHEVISFISVNGSNVTTNVKPGKNPCLATYAGNPLPSSELEYVALDKHDVTSLLHNQSAISISAQISPFVDECASQGFLLDAVAEINCTSEALAATPTPAATPAASLVQSALLIEERVGLKVRKL